MADFSEWDIILGEDPTEQARALSRMLRGQRALGDIVHLSGGQKFAPWGKEFSNSAQNDQKMLWLAAQARQKALEARALHEAQSRHWSEQTKAQRDIAAGHDAAHIRAAEINAGARQAATGATAKRKTLEAVTKYDQALQAIDNGLTIVEAHPEFFGGGKEVSAYFPGILARPVRTFQNNRRPPGESFGRSIVFKQIAEIIKETYGTAVTGTEDFRTNYLPQDNDNAIAVAEKMLALKSKVMNDRAIALRNAEAGLQQQEPPPMEAPVPGNPEDLGIPNLGTMPGPIPIPGQGGMAPSAPPPGVPIPMRPPARPPLQDRLNAYKSQVR